MALNGSGKISLAGSTTGESIALELNLSATGQISFNDTAVRTLAGIASGQISMPANFWGKSNGVPFGEALFQGNENLSTTYSFVVPTGVTEICAVCIGSGSNLANFPPYNGGSGGALSFSNGIPVTAGETLTIVVGGTGQSPAASYAGGDSYIARGGTILLKAAGSPMGSRGDAANGVGAVRYSGGSGAPYSSGGGGAAGYGGNGADAFVTTGQSASAPVGSGAGASGNTSTNQSQGGGGVGIIVKGADGVAPAGAGSGGQNGSVRGSGWGGLYGGGGGGHGDNSFGTTGRGVGGWGGVRIIYGGVDKTYPDNSAP